jgi:branched-chain amino acid transport system permease protein
VIGIANGSIIAMVAMSLVIIYRATGLLNFAQGEIAMLATFVVWQCHDAGVPLLLSLVIGMVAGFLIGAILQRFAVQPVGDASSAPLQLVIVTIGLLLVLNNAAGLIWGAETKVFDRFFGNSSWSVGQVSIRWEQLGTVGVLLLETAILVLIFKRTKIGLAMRAVASNPESSGLAGVPVARVLIISWGLAGAIGAIAGTFAAPESAMSPDLFLPILISAFAAMTIGGFDSLIGAIVGGLSVGILTEVVPRYVDAFQEMRLAPAVILILVVLMFRPQGLFGSRQVRRA